MLFEIVVVLMVLGIMFAIGDVIVRSAILRKTWIDIHFKSKLILIIVYFAIPSIYFESVLGNVSPTFRITVQLMMIILTVVNGMRLFKLNS